MPVPSEPLRNSDQLPAMIGLTLLRSLEVNETERLDFAEAYLVASAEATGVGAILSFDRSIDPVKTVSRIEP